MGPLLVLEHPDRAFLPGDTITNIVKLSPIEVQTCSLYLVMLGKAESHVKVGGGQDEHTTTARTPLMCELHGFPSTIQDFPDCATAVYLRFALKLPDTVTFSEDIPPPLYGHRNYRSDWY